eukprot:365556-Chlamydomonas_euryale.AAC.6
MSVRSWASTRDHANAPWNASVYWTGSPGPLLLRLLVELPACRRDTRAGPQEAPESDRRVPAHGQQCKAGLRGPAHLWILQPVGSRPWRPRQLVPLGTRLQRRGLDAGEGLTRVLLGR